MRKTTLSGAKGLLTTGRMLDAGANGYLAYCENVLIREDGVMTPRFGLESEASATSGITSLMYDLTNGQMLRASHTADRLDKGNGITWASLDTTRRYGYDAISARKRTYLLTDDGLVRINAGNTGVELAAIPEGLDPQVTTTGSTGWMGAQTQAAYVTVWGIKDSDDEFYLGAPSGRFVVTNSATNAVNTIVTVPIPASVTSSHFVQIYRTQQSGGVSVDPGADYYLVYEAYPTSAEITARLMTVTDFAANNNGGAALYTNEQEQTSLLGNYPCEAVLSSGGLGRLAFFSECIFACNYQPRSSIFLSLLGVQTANGLNAFTASATTNGTTTLSGIPAAEWGRLAVGMRVEGGDVAVGSRIASLGAVGTVTLTLPAVGSSTASRNFGDVVTIGGVEYYAWTSENITNREFLVAPLLPTSDPGVDIRTTSESFIRVFNRSTSNTIAYASYLSGPDEFPGRMIIRCRSDRASSYSIASTHGWAWAPNLSTAQTIQSVGDRGTLLISKPNEPFAWPLVSSINIAGNTVIYEMAALRGALILFTNRGIYRVTGSFQAWSIDQLDADAVVTVSSSGVSRGVAIVDNIAYAVTTRGVIAVTESSVRVVSGAVNAIVANRSADYNARVSAHRGEGYLFVPIEGVGTYVLHPRLAAWTMLAPILTCGDYDLTQRRMVFWDATTEKTRRQTNSEYNSVYMYDSSANVTISSVSGNTVTLAAPAPAGLAIGDVLFIGVDAVGSVTAISGSDVTLLPTGNAPIVAGAAFFVLGFDVVIRYAPITAGPGSRKNWVNGSLQYDTAEPNALSPSTYNNALLPKYTTITFQGDIESLPESVVGFSETPNHAHEYPFWVPATAKRATAMTLTARWRNCVMYPRFVGATIYIDDESQNVRR